MILSISGLELVIFAKGPEFDWPELPKHLVFGSIARLALLVSSQACFSRTHYNLIFSPCPASQRFVVLKDIGQT